MNTWKLEDFAIDLAALTTHPDHLWVGSGCASAHPVAGTVMAVRGLFAPPIAAADLLLDVTLEVDGHPVHDWGGGGKGDVGLLYAGGRWMPHALERVGTYHHRTADGLRSIHVTSRLLPLASRAGFVLEVEVENRATAKTRLLVHPEVKPGHPRRIPLAQWAFPKPAPGTDPAQPCGDGVWRNNDTTIRLMCPQRVLELDPGARGRFACVVTADGEDAAAPAEALAQEARENGQRRLDTYLAGVPRLSSSHGELKAYYQRSLVSGLVAIWESPAFLLHPHLATAGLDGGGLCAYAWDTGGYAPNLLTLMLGPRIHDIALQLARMDLARFYAFAPDGQPVGVAYAYSVWSFVRLAWTIFLHRGVDAALFAEARRLVLALEERADSRGLIDFGSHGDLLEMRGTGWEHVVASPNAERAWCLRRLAEVAEGVMGEAGLAADWRQRATVIERAIQQHLWDEKAGWFRCLHPGGHTELVYSVQAFDALRAGACTPPMQAALLRHLVTDGFLGHYGLSSVARADTIHYELNDPDWSGGGAYCGEGPQLAQTLYEAGEADLAWDLLQRFFWMGRHYPYFPQESYADRPQSPPHKRANIISGLTGAEAILFGRFGLEPKLDGALDLHPQPPPGEHLTLDGLLFRGHRIAITLESDRCSVTVDGLVAYDGPPQRIRVLPATANG